MVVGGNDVPQFRSIIEQLPLQEDIICGGCDVIYTWVPLPNPLRYAILSEDAKRCKSCHLDFCYKKKTIPFDVIFSHKERWMYPINGDWANCRPSNRETIRYYHAAKKCLMGQFPYFSKEYIHIPGDVKDSLRDSHKTYLTSEFELNFD